MESEQGWRRPTADEARFFAEALELQISGEVTLGVICPELLLEVVPQLAERWERDVRVRAYRFDLRAWMEKSGEDRMKQAVSRVYNAMAWYLVQTNVAEATGAVLQKALKFLECLERKLAGMAGQQDVSLKWWEDFLAQKPGGAPKRGPKTVVGVPQPSGPEGVQ